MARPKKRKLRVRQRAQVRKKGEGNKKVSPTKTISTDNGATFKVKIKKKG